ncbi:unnamed protein product [Caenorhabditis nigoni]
MESEKFGCQSMMTLLALSFATSAVPFAMVENEFFKEFLKKSGIVISADSLRKIIVDMSVDSRKILESQLKDKFNLTIAFDGWSSPNCTFHCYSVFCIFVDAFYERKTMLIGCKSLEGSATSERVSDLISSVLESVGISYNNIKYAVTDNGSNLVKMAETLKITRLPCACHILSNIFKSIFQHRHLELVMKKAKSVAKILCKSAVLKEKFLKFAKILKPGTKSPRSFSPTRWGGGYLLLRDYINAIEILRSIPELVEHLPSTEEKEKAEITIELLEDVFIVMTTLEGDSSTASSTVPNLIALDNHIGNNRNSTTGIGKFIKNEFRRRTKDIVTDMNFLVLSFLDPRFCYHKNALGKTDWKVVEKQFIESFESNKDDAKSLCSSSSTKLINNNLKTNLSPLANLLQNKDDLDEESSNLKTEITRYKAHITQHSRPTHDTDPLDYWKVNSFSFPLLSKIARELLSIPSSSASTERIFSKTSYIYSNPRRNRLNPITLESVLLVSAGAHLLSENSKIFQSRNAGEDLEEEIIVTPPVNAEKDGESSVAIVKKRQRDENDKKDDGIQKKLCSESIESLSFLNSKSEHISDSSMIEQQSDAHSSASSHSSDSELTGDET